MKEEFRKIANEMINNPVLAWFEKTFCELCCRCDEDRFKRLIKAFPEVVEKITRNYKERK